MCLRRRVIVDWVDVDRDILKRIFVGSEPLSQTLIDWHDLAACARQISDSLERLQSVKFVLAESCTAGLASAALGSIPGISRFFLGTTVVYRPETKTNWLNIPANWLQGVTCESAEASAALAVNVLERTPAAHLSWAITGHLGPQAPVEKDGRIWIATAQRRQRPRWTADLGDSTPDDMAEPMQMNKSSNWEVQIQPYAVIRLASAERDRRQFEAAHHLLRRLLEFIRVMDD